MRRSTRASVLDDRTFAVRCRVEIPLGGMRCLDEMHRWFRGKVGREGYAFHSSSFNHLGKDGMYIHCVDAAVATEAIALFGLVVFSLPRETPSGMGGVQF